MGVVSASSLAQTRIFLDRDLQETFAELVSMTGSNHYQVLREVGAGPY